MAIIRTHRNDEIIVDDEDFAILSRHSWHFDGKRVFCHLGNGENRLSIPMSRFILGPPNQKVWDHINRNPLDNRKENLRALSVQRNKLNSEFSAEKKFRFKGIRESNNKKFPFGAQITFNGKTIFLGNFATEIDAAIAYDEKAKALFGDFAVLNFA